MYFTAIGEATIPVYFTFKEEGTRKKIATEIYSVQGLLLTQRKGFCWEIRSYLPPQLSAKVSKGQGRKRYFTVNYKIRKKCFSFLKIIQISAFFHFSIIIMIMLSPMEHPFLSVTTSRAGRKSLYSNTFPIMSNFFKDN